MTIWSRFRSWLRAALWRSRMENEMDAELHFHIESYAEDLTRSGLPREEALRRARLAFGGLDRAKEECRDARGVNLIETTTQDVRYGLRMLAKNPGFTTVAVLTLALGIGANTAIFSLVNAVLLKALPVRNPEQLARVEVYRGDSSRNLSYPAFRDLAARQQVVTGMAASGEFAPDRAILGSSSGLQDLDRTSGHFVSANYFSLLGVNAAIGRVFTAEDSRTSGEGAVAVISFGFWERQFGRDRSALGRTLLLNGTPFTIIGVAPRRFFGDQVGLAPDFWIPILMQPRLESRDMLERRTATWFRTIARLKPGISKNQAETVLTVLFQRYMAEEIASGSGSLISHDKRQDFRVRLEAGSSGLNALGSELGRPLQLLMAVVGLVLLLACCNIANLLLARALARQKEIAVRAALGAGRARLIRQFVTESTLLATVGGAFGLLMAWWSSDLLLALLSAGGETVSLDLRPDLPVLAFTLAVSLLSGIMFGLIPALQATSLDLVTSAQANSNNLTHGRPKRRMTRALIVSQVAISLCLLVGAGLLVRTLQNLRNQDIGVERENVLMLDVLADPKAVKRTEFSNLRRRLLERLKAIPGVHSVSCSGYGLFSGSASTAPVRVPGSSVNPEKGDEVRENWVSPEYFETLGMKLILGTTFTDQDTQTAPKVAVVNEALARHYFGAENPIGKTIYFPKEDAEGRYIPFGPKLDKEQGVEVVGVVQDAKYDDLREPTPTMAYMSISQSEGFPQSVEVRISNNANAVASTLRQILKQVSSGLVLRDVKTLKQQIDETLVQERLLTKLLGLFGLLALVLAWVGLYGIMSYAVARRTREIGIRMALGAQRADVVGMVVAEGMLPVILGIGAGITAALALTRFLGSVLFGVRPTDPATFALVSLLLMGVALLACRIPARRATKVDPMVALRYE